MSNGDHYKAKGLKCIYIEEVIQKGFFTFEVPDHN